jgi:hypothetical protein
VSLTCSDKVSSEKSIQEETLKAQLTQPLRASKKKKAKTSNGEGKEEAK